MQTIDYHRANRPQKIGYGSSNDCSETGVAPFDDRGEGDDLTPSQMGWLTILLRVAELYPQSPVAERSEVQLISMARIWADDLKFIPHSQIWECYTEAMRCAKTDFVPSAGSFRAAWERLQAQTPRETFREADERVNGPLTPELRAAPREVPLAARIFREMGRAIVCCCKYPDGVAMAAQIEDLNGPRWVCGRGVCGFNIDAGDESVVQEKSVLPHSMSNGVEVVSSSPAGESVSQSRAELFAESCNLDWEKMDGGMRAQIGQMAKWNDATNARTDAGNFGEMWGRFCQSLVESG